MAIYGTALLSICLLCGMVLGNLIGLAVGVDANVGGVGIAMLLLIVATGRLQARGLLPKPTQDGVVFWSSVYIPIVVAMAASQNVRAAVTGGSVALVAGGTAVAAGFVLVPVISGLARGNEDDESLSSPLTSGDEP